MAARAAPERPEGHFQNETWGSCDLLLFAQGRRLVGQSAHDLVWLSCGESGWSSGGWAMDEHGEWESHPTDARWGSG